MIQAHLKAIVDMPMINNKSPNLLRDLNETLEKNLHAIKTLGEPTESWDRIIILLIGRKLDRHKKRVETKNYFRF